MYWNKTLRQTFSITGTIYIGLSVSEVCGYVFDSGMDF